MNLSKFMHYKRRDSVSSFIFLFMAHQISLNLTSIGCPLKNETRYFGMGLWNRDWYTNIRHLSTFHGFMQKRFHSWHWTWRFRNLWTTEKCQSTRNRNKGEWSSFCYLRDGLAIKLRSAFAISMRRLSTLARPCFDGSKRSAAGRGASTRTISRESRLIRGKQWYSKCPQR
jgi:hypothetical protein